MCFLVITTIYSRTILAQQPNDSTISQTEIIGVWQINSSLVTSTLQANFQFFKTGKFVFNINGYDDLNPIYNISGSYKIERGILYLKIQQFRELVGFKIAESSPAFQFGSFVLEGGKIVTVKQTDTTFVEHEINVVNNPKASAKCITIDNTKYYKLSSDPNKFTK